MREAKKILHHYLFYYTWDLEGGALFLLVCSVCSVWCDISKTTRGIERVEISQSLTEWLRRVLSIQRFITFLCFCCFTALLATYPTTVLAAWLQTCSRDWPTSLNCKRRINWFCKNIILCGGIGYQVNLFIRDCYDRNLSGNIISTMDPGVFQELPSLKQVWVFNTFALTAYHHIWVR